VFTSAVRHAALLSLPLAALLLLLWLELPPRLGQPPAGHSTTRVAGASGRLAVGRPDGLWLVPLNGGEPSRLVPVSGGAFITGVAWAPSGTEIAYTLFSFQPGGVVGGADLHLVGLAGSDRMLVPRDDPDTLLSTPVWTPDGAALLFDVTHVNAGGAGGATRRIDRVAADGSGRTTVVQDGYAPSLSRDGRRLSYLRQSGSEVAIRLRELASGDERVVLPPGTVSGIIVPALSPDGSALVFGAAGGPGLAPAPGRCPGLAPQARGLEAGVALAHGLPEELWRVNTDGTGLTRLTNLCLDDPIVAWSADGVWLAAYGATGLLLLPASGGAAVPLPSPGGYGGVSWLP